MDEETTIASIACGPSTMYLTQLLHRHARARPQTTALVCGDQRRSYAQLAVQAGRLAAALQSQGVRAGDRVALLSAHSVETVELMLACWWLGAVFCPQNIRWSVAEITDALRDCEPTVVCADAANRELARAVQAAVPGCLPLLPMDIPRAAHALPDARHGGDTLAALIYTGGTTGRSKGVMLTHAGLGAAAISRLSELAPLEGSVALLTTPNFHVASLIRSLTHLIAGSTVVILPQFRADEALDLIEQEHVTDLPVVPTMLQMLLEHPHFQPQRMRSVQRLSYGAAPSAQAVLQHTQTLLPWVGLYQYYGMTESCGVATVSLPQDHRPEDWASGRARTVGRAGVVVELRVVDTQGQDAAAGQVGEILLRGPLVSPGYWRRPEETARTFRDGWLHTGDAGSLDDDGYLQVVDRIKDMIVTGGENVYSVEVENALACHPAISGVAVFGIPHARWGEAVHAVVVLRQDAGSASEAELRAHCRTRIADYKVPKTIEFAQVLPLTPAGKIAKNVLREPHWAGQARRVA